MDIAGEITLFKNSTRQIIYTYILENPGTHLRDLSRKLNIKIYALKYHIRILNQDGYLTQKKENGFLRFFVKNIVSNEEKELFFYLRKKTTRNIILIILYNIAASQKEICDLLQRSPPNVKFHINKLLESNIIEVAPCNKGIISRVQKPKLLKKELTGREIVFRLTDPDAVYEFINKYRDTILDKDTKIILDAINSSVKEGDPKAKIGFFGTSSYEPYINYLSEIFPHPYHV